MIIVPDIHGRDFWKDCKDSNDTIIFLGDYVDPYPFQFPKHFDYKRHAIENFKEIIEFKKQRMDSVILLLGNHDCTYFFSKNICNCRCDAAHFDEISELFRSNFNLFQLTYETIINEKHFVFSHAGIHKEFAEYMFGENVNSSNVCEKFNSLYNYCEAVDETGAATNFQVFSNMCRGLSMCSYLRGGYGKTGSIVWADLGEWDFNDDTEWKDIIQIVGHSQLKNDGDILNLDNYLYCIDSRKAFNLDNNGELSVFNK